MVCSRIHKTMSSSDVEEISLLCYLNNAEQIASIHSFVVFNKTGKLEVCEIVVSGESYLRDKELTIRNGRQNSRVA